MVLLAGSNFAVVFALVALSLPRQLLCGGITAEERQTGITRLHAAASLGYTTSVLEQLARGVPADVRDKHGATPLHHAIVMDRAAAADALLARGADVRAPDHRGMTPLHYAVHAAAKSSEMRADAVELLLARGAPINATRHDGETPLHVVAFMGHPEIAALLLARGADVNAVAENGTPLDVAYGRKNIKLIEFLHEHGAIRATDKMREAKISEPRSRSAPAGSCAV